MTSQDSFITGSGASAALVSSLASGGWFPVPAPSPAPRLLAHLAEVGFTRMPTPYAAVWRSDLLVALVAAYLPGAYDGWDW